MLVCNVCFCFFLFGGDLALYALMYELGMFVPELGRVIHAARLFLSQLWTFRTRAWELLGPDWGTPSMKYTRYGLLKV